MKTFRYWSAIPILLCLGVAAALAQDPNVRPKLIITPHEALVQPGQGLKFEVAAYGPDGNPQRVESVRWSVEPDTLGKITEDGFFMAGRFPGKGRVLAFAKVPQFNELLQAEAVIAVGEPNPPRVLVVVSPAFAVVPPGASEQFKAEAYTPARVPIPIKNVRWNVRPENLGHMDETGRFTAGPNFGQGVILAFVETEMGVFSGEAQVTIAARPNSAIRGKVSTSASDLAQLGGVVSAESVGPNRWRREAKIDSEGNYFIGELVSGLYVVRAQARGYLPEYYQEASDYLQATPVQVAARDTVEGINFTLDRGGALSGTVGADDRDGLLTGAHVYAVLVVRPEMRYHAMTNEQGGYSIENLPSGTYAVFAEAEGYKGEYYDNARGLLDAKLIQVAAPQIVDGIHFSLAPGSAIAGQVQDAVTMAAIAHARVAIMPAPLSPLPFLRVVETDEGGQYLASVPPGRYLVQVEARGYLPEFYDGVRNPREAKVVEVQADQHTTGIDFKLDQLGGISGTVVEQNNGSAPVIGAVVLAFPERGSAGDPTVPNAAFPARTDSLGVYKIANVPPGKYYVLAEARGFLNEYWQEAPDLSSAQLVEVGEGGGRTDINFTLEKGGALAGMVVAASDGKPVAGAQVQVWNRASNAPARGETDRAGNYLIGGLRTGEYLVSVEAKGFRPQFFDGVEARERATPVKVEAPQETRGINFKLAPVEARRGAISGLVVSEGEGNPVPEAVVLALPLASGAPQMAFADRMGAYKISGLAGGRYVVFTYAPHFLGEFFDNARSFEAATPVAVTLGQETGGIDFKLAPRQRGAYTIAGTINRGNTDQGESNAVVYAVENDIFVASAVTDPNGDYVIDELPAGTYKLMATASGGTAFFGGREASNASPVVLGNGTSASNITFSVPVSVTAVEENRGALPATFDLGQNYPNPFNPDTEIPYQLAGRSSVQLIIYNALGQEVRRLVSATQEAGTYRVRWDGKDNLGHALGSGVYIYRLHAGAQVFTHKMIYLR